MGYTTDFEGHLKFNKNLTEAQFEYINAFSSIRHMKRDNSILENSPDPLRIAVGLPLGIDSEYYVGTTKQRNCGGQDNRLGVMDYNKQPYTQPGLWCQWIVSDYKQNDILEWDGSEKFYSYIDWLKYLMENFFIPWGYVLNGTIKWQGENMGDTGLIEVKDNNIIVYTLNGILEKEAQKISINPVMSNKPVTKKKLVTKTVTSSKNGMVYILFHKGMYISVTASKNIADKWKKKSVNHTFKPEPLLTKL